MFSSAFTIKAEARLRSGSRKKLKTELTSRFPSLAFDDGRSLNALLPSSQKSGQPLNETSVDIITATGQTGTVVLVDGEPMFYRDGHEGIIPTVYALWKVPHLCQLQIETTDIRDSKSQEQLGIDEVHGLPERDLNYQPGEPVVLTVSRDGKRVAYGVGITLASKSEISSGKKKKFARIVHVYGDHLWLYGSKYAPTGLASCGTSVRGETTDAESRDGDEESLGAKSSAVDDNEFGVGIFATLPRAGAGMRAEPKKLRSPTTSLASFTSYISNIGSYVAQNLPDKFVAGTAPRDSAGHDDVGETILFSKFEWVDWNLPLPQLSLPDPERLISPAWYSRRLCLLLGYASGIQVWSLGDLENIREVFSVRGYYESIQNIVALPMPERSTTLSDSFASARPLIAVVAEAKGSSRFEGRAAHFMSLATNQVIFTFRQREREKIKEVKATTRHVLIGTSTSIHVLSAHSLSTLVVINDVFINPATETPSFDIGARFLAYACQGPISTIPRTTAIVDDRSEGGSDDDAVESSVAINAEKIGKAAGKVAKELIGGVKVIGGYGYQALSSYFSGTQPRPTHSGLDASETEASSSGAPRDSEKKSDHRQGYIAVRDLGLLGKSATDDSTLLPPAVACWKAHENPVAIVMFTPSQTRLITVSTHGNNCYIWELPGRPKADRSPHVPHCIYKLERGYTHAVVEDITCSLDGKWVGVSTAKGTTHLYGLEPSERKAEGSSSSPSDGALPVYSPPATQARTTTPLYPAARIRQAAPLDKKASLETLPPLPPNPAIDGFGRSASSASQTSLASQKGFYQQQQPASRSFVAETPRGSTTGRSLLIACFGLDEESVFANSARESKVRAESGRHAASKPNGAASHPFEQGKSNLWRRRLLVFNPNGHLTLHFIDASIEHRASAIVTPPKPASGDRFSPSSLLSTALHGMSTSSRSPGSLGSSAFDHGAPSSNAVQISATEIVEWCLQRECEWDEVRTLALEAPKAKREHESSEKHSQRWKSEIEISSYNQVVPERPIWMGPSFQFFEFVGSQTLQAKDEGKSVVSRKSDQTDLPAARSLLINREVLKPYRDDGTPHSELFPSVHEGELADISSDISNAMNSALEVQKMRRSQPIAFGSPDSGGGIAIQAPSRTGGARQSYSVSPAHMDSSIIRSFEEQGVHVPRGGMIINHDEDDGEGDVDESEGRDRDGYSDDGEDEGGGDQDEDGHMHDDDDDDDDDNDDGEGDDGEEGDDDDDDEGSSRATYLAEAMDADLNIHNYGSSKKRQTIPKSTEL